jgi:hypothetical protein
MTTEILDVDDSIIECNFVQIKQFSNMASDGTNETRSGRYSGSIHSIENFGSKRWVVLAYLAADFNKYREQKMSDVEIIKKCLKFLNEPESRKKYQKKESVPKYGNLLLASENIKFTNKFGYESAILELVIDQRKNENFWGEGEKL